jgi:hypothetical protein
MPRMTVNQVDIDLDILGTSGFNCLHAACASGNIEMLKYLIS